MLMCEFLTAVHHKLRVKVVVYNNSAFRVDLVRSGVRGITRLQEGN